MEQSVIDEMKQDLEALERSIKDMEREITQARGEREFWKGVACGLDPSTPLSEVPDEKLEEYARMRKGVAALFKYESGGGA